jgi:pSer/pThr/pTyr-binding forkhead associated (FHA) protein
LAVCGVIVIGVLFWLIFRRRREDFPEIKFMVESQAPEKDMTMIENQPLKAVRSAPVPGIYGKIEVLVGTQQINTYLVTDNPLTVGRDPAQALAIIQEAIVSKLHCSIFYRDGQVVIKDLDSTNGTYVNEEKISEQELHDNDVVFLGKKGTIKIIYHK